MNFNYSMNVAQPARDLSRNHKQKDRFIPYQGSTRDQEIVEYMMRPSHLCISQFYWTRYRKDLVEACFDMRVEDFKALSVHRWSPAPQLDHSLQAEYKRLESLNQVGTKVLNTRAPQIVDQWEIPEISDNYYLNLLDVSSQDFLAVGSYSNVYYHPLHFKRDTQVVGLDRIAQTEVTSVKWMHQGRTLVVGDVEGVCEIWDVEKKCCMRDIEIGTTRISVSTSLNDKSSIFFTGSRDGSIKKFDLRQKPALVSDWNSVGGEICGLKVSPDERWIVSGSNCNQVHIWDVNGKDDADPMGVLNGHKASVKALAWHNDPRLVFTGGGSDDRTIKLWDLTQIEHPSLVCSQNCDAQITSLQWVKHRLFATTGFGFAENELSSWSVNLKDMVVSKEHGLVAHENRISTSALSKDRSKLVTLGTDNVIKVWDIKESIDPKQASRGAQKKSQPLVAQFSIR